MNELEILRDFCAEEAPPAPQRLAAVRARLVARFDAAPLSHAQGRRRRRFALPNLALTGGVAALAAVVATAVLIITSGVGSAGPASRPVRLDAAVVLHRAALAALSAPAPGTGRFIYAQVVTRSETGTGHGDHRSDLVRSLEWVSVTGTQPSTFSTPSCQQPGPIRVTCAFRTTAGGLFFTYAGLEKMPTAPGALLDYLYRSQSGSCPPGTDVTVSRADLEWAAIYSIMNDVPVLPPHFAAALFTAAAQIPGVTVVGNATTAAGQPGIAVARTVRPLASQDPHHGPWRLEFIFSPHSYRSIGMSVTQLKAPVSTAALAVTGSRFVATAPSAGPLIQTSEGECWTGLRPMLG